MTDPARRRARSTPLTLLRDRDGNQPPADWEPEEIGGRSEIVDQRPGAAGIIPLQGDTILTMHPGASPDHGVG